MDFNSTFKWTSMEIFFSLLFFFCLQNVGIYQQWLTDYQLNLDLLVRDLGLCK